MSKYKFPVYDLTPTDEAEGIGCYTYMLNEVLGRKEVKNIAIAGRYGSGKSSFLNTFFKSRMDEKVLRISMAAFLEKEGEQKMDEPRERLLEISILQQMFYHVTQGELPFSRFRRLTRFGREKWLPLLMYFLSFIVAMVFMVQPHSMTQHLSPYFVCKVTNCAYWIGAGMLGVLGSIGFVQLLCFYRKIKHCNLNFQNIELDIKKEDETSVFNRYMDEVVYFFEETGYTTVLFEDIDRFKDVRIFAKLRELNLILNQAKQIEQKPIRFIYALRDNMFTGTERVKFFDFILPIVPVVDSKSSAAKLKEMLAAYLGEEKVAEYDEMIHAIAPYVSDMRLMNNILNEFAAYRTMISTQGNGLQFLGMMIFKNFFPSEFAKLYERTESLLTRIFARKKDIARAKVEELDLEQRKIRTAIAASKDEKLRNVAELQSLYMVRCVGNVLPAHAAEIEWKGQSKIRLSEFFNAPELFNSLHGNDFNISYLSYDRYYGRWSNNTSTYAWGEAYTDVQKELGSYEKRVKAIEDRAAEKSEEYNQRIEKLGVEKDAVYRLSLSDLIKKGWVDEEDIADAITECYSASDGDDEVVVKRETILLLYQLLYGGYIGENYEHFISVFKEGDTTRGDNDFETAVLENVEHQFNHPLDDPAAVADHVGVGMFTKPAVRNLDLVEAMINARDRYKDKLEAFASQFLKNTADNQRFAVELMLRVSGDAACATKIIGFYVEHWETCIDDLFKDGNLTADEKVRLTEACLRWISSTKGKLPSEVGAYIAKAKHPCEMFKHAGYDPEKMVELLGEAKVRFENCVFESDAEKAYVDAVRHAGCYLYGDGMLERLMVASGVDTTNFSQAPMSCVRNCNLPDMIDDVNANFDYFVETFYVGEKSEKEDAPDVITDVLNTSDFEVKDREAFAKAQKRQIEDLALIKDDDLSKRLLLANMVVPSWKNVAHSAERFKYDSDAQGFLAKNREALASQDWQPVEEALRKWIDWLISTETIPVDALDVASKLFPAPVKISTLSKVDIPAERIRVATACGRIKFTPELYEQLKKAGKDGHMELAEGCSTEFVQACKCHEWKMLYKDLIRIFIGDRFSENQKLEILQMYEGATSKDEVARAASTVLTRKNYKKFSATVLEGVFPHLAQPDLQILILQRLDPAPEKVKTMLAQMKEPYNAVLDEQCRKTLLHTALNRSFVKFLIGKGLIVVKKSDSTVDVK